MDCTRAGTVQLDVIRPGRVPNTTIICSAAPCSLYHKAEKSTTVKSDRYGEGILYGDAYGRGMS